jgi:hypothetical protein
MAAAADESTPPDMATAIFMSDSGFRLPDFGLSQPML